MPKRREQDIDETAARELDLYAENTSELYPQFTAIVRNLARKVKAGKYDAAKASKLWAYWYEAAAKRYVREFGTSPSEWSTMFPKALRDHLARERAEQEHRNILSEEYDRL